MTPVVIDPQSSIDAQQHVTVQQGTRVKTSAVVWTQRTTSPDLMAAFRSVLDTLPEPASVAPRPMTPEDLDALTEWLRSDSLDWDSLERGDAWND